MSEPKSIKETIRPLLMLNLLFGMGVLPDGKKCVRLIEYVNTIIFLVLYNVFSALSINSFNKYYIISIYNLCKETNFYTGLISFLIINGLVIATSAQAKVISVIRKSFTIVLRFC